MKVVVTTAGQHQAVLGASSVVPHRASSLRSARPGDQTHRHRNRGATLSSGIPDGVCRLKSTGARSRHGIDPVGLPANDCTVHGRWRFAPQRCRGVPMWSISVCANGTWCRRDRRPRWWVEDQGGAAAVRLVPACRQSPTELSKRDAVGRNEMTITRDGGALIARLSRYPV